VAPVDSGEQEVRGRWGWERGATLWHGETIFGQRGGKGLTDNGSPWWHARSEESRQRERGPVVASGVGGVVEHRGATVELGVAEGRRFHDPRQMRW
jgi:hypothetical protein